MFKFVLSALMSLMIAVAPIQVSANVTQKPSATKLKKASVKKAGVKKQRVSRTKARVAKRGARQKIVISNGRRQIYARNFAPAAPRYIAPSVGERAGLHLTPDPLELRSNVAFVIDQNNLQVLFEKNANISLPIASITKLMTGLIVVQAGQDLNEMLTVSQDDVDTHKFTRSRLAVGSRMSRADLLHISLMSSENRAAAALGRNYPGGIQGFVATMNAKAHELGMTETHYVDSSGLSSKNVASARDLAKLALAAYKEPLLRQYSTDPNSTVAAGGRVINYRNTNYLVALPDWEIGLQKTGFINEAGRCLVMQAMVQGRAVIMVFLDAKGKQSRTADAGRVRRWLEGMNPIGIM